MRLPNVLGLLAVAALMAPAPAAGQQRGGDLGQLYRRARSEALAARLKDRQAVSMAPVPLRTPVLDTLRTWLDPEALVREDRPTMPALRVYKRHAVRRLERPAYADRFEGERWAYLGTSGTAVLDTMQTREIRARLQAQFGDPTRTVVDADTLDGRPVSDYVQFEYWLTANDSIPIKVLDTGGPFDRGLVFAAPSSYRGQLRALRAAVFAPLVGSRLRAAYVDYYYDTETGVWYRTGFDGRRFFTRPAPRSAVVPGQRPVLPRDR